MFTSNRFGKVALLVGVIGLVLAVLGAYSKHLYDGTNPTLSTAVNTLVVPVIGAISNLFSGPVAQGPSMRAAGLFPLFEEEAIVLFFIVGGILSVAAVAFSILATKKQEHTFWYTNAMLCSGYALFLVNKILAFLVIIISVAAILNIRKKHEIQEP